jgi:hypothetical protein
VYIYEPWKCLARHPTKSTTIGFRSSLLPLSLMEKSLACCPHGVILKDMSLQTNKGNQKQEDTL